MKTRKIKAWLTKASTFTLALLIVAFGLGSSIVIFAESVNLILAMGYTKEKAAVIMACIGLVLIWLATLLGDSAHALMRVGFKKASEVEEN
jgi:uncharacterized membrane protein